MKRILWILMVVVVVAGGAWGYTYSQGRGTTPKYRTARVDQSMDRTGTS